MSKSIEGQKWDAKTEEGKLIFRFIVKKKDLQRKLRDWKGVESRLIYGLIGTSWELISSIVKE